MQNKQIDKIRENINEIDSAILALLQNRLVYAKEIGRLKKAADRKVEDRKREEEVLQRMVSENNGIFPEETIRAIYTEIIAACKKSQ